MNSAEILQHSADIKLTIVTFLKINKTFIKTFIRSSFRMMKLGIVSTVGRCGGLFGVDPGLELLDEVLAFAVALVLLSWALLV